MQSYRYQPKLAPVLLALPLLGLLSLFAIRDGLTGTRAMTINHIIQLTPGQAAMLMLTLGLAVAAFVVACGVVCVMAWVRPRHVRLGSSEMSLPGPLFRRDLEIRYADISHVAMRGNQRDRRLEIRHADGVADIMASLLPRPSDLKAIAQTLADRAAVMRRARGTQERSDPLKPVFGRRSPA